MGTLMIEMTSTVYSCVFCLTIMCIVRKAYISTRDTLVGLITLMAFGQIDFKIQIKNA